MPVASDPGKVGDKEIKTDWPVTEGITAGTTKQRTASPRLEPEVDLTGG